jgi:hypothetical protein
VGLAPEEGEEEEEEIGHPPAMAQERVRWCKKCRVVFEGSACLQGHPNFMYTRRIPKEAGALSIAEVAGARSDPRLQF